MDARNVMVLLLQTALLVEPITQFHTTNTWDSILVDWGVHWVNLSIPARVTHVGSVVQDAWDVRDRRLIALLPMDAVPVLISTLLRILVWLPAPALSTPP